MTETEEEVKKIQKQIEALAPQAQMMAQLWQPLQEMLGELMAKFGVEVSAGKIIYMKNQGRLIYGIEFRGPPEVLDRIVEAMKGGEGEGEEE